MRWPVREELYDKGLSAYTGENLRSGELGKLTERLKAQGGHGLVLVVEKLDRLSRQPPMIMLNWIQEVCAAGLTIATVDGRHMIDQQALIKMPMPIMAIVVEAFLGFEESQKKSDRGLENWRIKRESGRPLTARCVAWLRLSKDRTRYEHVPERVALVKRICELRLKRVHKERIASMLNAEGVAPWGRGKRWHASYIDKITKNVALVGDHMHGTKRRGDAKRTLSGVVIKGYYPPVIDEATFATLNSHRLNAVLKTQKGATIVNLFAGLARCSCGSIMTLRAKGTKVRSNGQVVREDYLRCDSALRPAKGLTCDHRTSYNYNLVREVILDELLHKALDDQFFTAPDEAAPLLEEVAARQRHLSDQRRRMKAAFEMVEDDPSDEHARSRYRTLKGEVRKIEIELADAQDRLAVASGAVTPREHIARVSEVRALMDSIDEGERREARIRVKLALNDLLELIVFDAQSERIAVHLIAGVGLLFISKTGQRDWFDMAKDGRDYSWLPAEQQQVVEAYLRRRAG